ncbi:Wadjet anti-phage system protein JetA family protein [Salinibius halmophilus]|uniref:Wadjet anti-phage system protein JetA family protein n=1 Tax=Salinibius halmophilus TaxID=1853216 RepID=UPI000E6688AB|nr:Wadjet anti-phage system protein JetA family protein [Salinibius halmophilus]
MFFSGKQQDFFRPLTSKYREQIAAGLKALYQRLYDANKVERGLMLTRADVLALLAEGIAQHEVITDVLEDDQAGAERFKDKREQAAWVLNQLINYGWLERHLDEANYQVSYGFSEMGRKFTEPFIAPQQPVRQIRHRNARNTRNALRSFVTHGDVYDLLEANAASDNIVTDFSDMIEELEAKRRQLVKEVSDQAELSQASDAFFDFMEKRFKPDLAIRLSADNVEKYRLQINQLVSDIRSQDNDWKRDAEERLRALMPDQAGKESLLWRYLDVVNQRVNNACDVMLPTLRQALNQFTKRGELIIRQLSFAAQPTQALNQAVQNWRQSGQLDAQLDQMADALSGVRVRLVDPGSLSLRERTNRDIDQSIQTEQKLSQDQQQALHVERKLSEAFSIQKQWLGSWLSEQQGCASKNALPVNQATDLLAISHLLDAGDGWFIEPVLNEAGEPVQVEIKNQQGEVIAVQDDFSVRVAS